VRILLAMLVLVLLPAVASAAGDPSALEAQLARSPYDDAARQDLVAAYRDSRDYGAAYYHAAWLTWLAAGQYADSDLGAAFLRTREFRDRASRSDIRGLQVVLAAVEAQRKLHDTCFNGAISQQAGRLRKDIADLLARADAAESGAAKNDPVARIALARLALTLDDALVFENTSASHRARPAVLRAVASRAAAVAAWLPEAPGPHYTLALARARLAELDNRSALWDMAIAEAQRALQLDPDNPQIVELLWTIHLRAGRWAEARTWESRVDSFANSCDAD
jgi:hypothetical protein